MIVSDPEIDPRRVLLLSLTTYRDGKEDVCLIERGQHPFVRHTTCVAYDIAKVVTLDQLTAFRDSGQLEIQAPANEELLARSDRVFLCLVGSKCNMWI